MSAVAAVAMRWALVAGDGNGVLLKRILQKQRTIARMTMEEVAAPVGVPDCALSRRCRMQGGSLPLLLFHLSLLLIMLLQVPRRLMLMSSRVVADYPLHLLHQDIAVVSSGDDPEEVTFCERSYVREGSGA